jgi:hypothetical protein
MNKFDIIFCNFHFAHLIFEEKQSEMNSIRSFAANVYKRAHDAFTEKGLRIEQILDVGISFVYFSDFKSNFAAFRHFDRHISD